MWSHIFLFGSLPRRRPPEFTAILMFEFWREATATSVPGLLYQSDSRLWIAVVNRVSVYICINYFFVPSLTVEKTHVRRKIALASVHRLAEHLYAMSTQKYRYKISDYSQARSSVSPKITRSWCINYSKVEPLVVVDFRFVSVCILECVMSREFTRDSVTKFLPS